jgi:hypothetical protein
MVSPTVRCVRLVMICGLTAMLGGCGIKAKPIAGTAHIDEAPGSHATVDDPRVVHASCLRQHGLAIREYRTSSNLPAIQVGSPPDGPTIVFEATPGIAQGLQIHGQDQGAEVIGAALLFPNQSSDKVASVVEQCVALRVTG